VLTNNGKYPERFHVARISLAAASSIQFSFMHPLLFSLSLFPALIFAAGFPQTRGVHPSLLSQYKPKGATWTCLDGIKTIPWSAVNDDYCDCTDGSDEPGTFLSAVVFTQVLQASLGTSACSGNTFYCANEGHIGASIPSSRVNDGLCGRFFALPYPPSTDTSSEPACCDGSDEPAGVCENTCAAIGELYRQKQEAARKLQKTVSTAVRLAIRGSDLVFRVRKSVRHTLPSHKKRRND
jgi:protein kinase C substrate 80K-H